MSLEKVDKFLQETTKDRMWTAIFLEPKKAVDTAKEMIDLISDNVKITMPFNMEIMSKKEAKEYIEEYNGESEGKCQRYLDFYEKGMTKKSLWLELYKHIEEPCDAADMLSWG